MMRILTALLVLATGTAVAGGPVFDVHVHLRDGEASLQAYQADVEAAGIKLAGVGAMWFGGPHQAREGQLEEMREGNDSVIALATSHPLVLPIATVHPYDEEAALAELARVVQAGVRVLKLHAHTQGFDVADPRVEALVRRAGELGVIVLMDNAHILPGDSEKLFNLVARVPGTRFILAHMAGANFRYWNILALARTADGFAMDNLYFDISGPVLLAAGSPIEHEFVWTLRNVGIDHVLLGSDYPQMSLGAMADALEQLDLTDEEKDKIRVANARRLFGLDGPALASDGSVRTAGHGPADATGTTVGGDGSDIELLPLTASDVEVAALAGELACSFSVDPGGALLLAKGNVASDDASRGVVNVAGYVEPVAAPGGFDAMLRGTRFSGAGKVILVELTGPAIGGGESPAHPAALIYQRADGAERTFAGLWQCGP